MPLIVKKGQQPAYKRPFEQADFRGYLTWTGAFAAKLGGSLYHACHKEELDEILKGNELGLRSMWEIMLPGHQTAWKSPGVWCGLNNFGAWGNFYGPLQLSFPISVLNGRKFMVFRRREDNRERLFFVQHESPLPVFTFKDKGKLLAKRVVVPEWYFDKSAGECSLKAGTIYDLVLTTPIPLDECEIHEGNHPKCIPAKCGGSASMASRIDLKRAGKKQARRLIRQSDDIQQLLKRIPALTIDDLLPE